MILNRCLLWTVSCVCFRRARCVGVAWMRCWRPAPVGAPGHSSWPRDAAPSPGAGCVCTWTDSPTVGRMYAGGIAECRCSECRRVCSRAAKCWWPTWGSWPDGPLRRYSRGWQWVEAAGSPCMVPPSRAQPHKTRALPIAESEAQTLASQLRRSDCTRSDKTAWSRRGLSLPSRTAAHPSLCCVGGEWNFNDAASSAAGRRALADCVGPSPTGD